MSSDKLIASVFSSAVGTSLSERQNNGKKKKKKNVVVKQLVKTLPAKAFPAEAVLPKTVPVKIAQPVESTEWVSVGSKTAGTGSKTSTAGSSKKACKSSSTTVNDSLHQTTPKKKDTLTTNAFYLPKQLEKHLHKTAPPATNTETPKFDLVAVEETRKTSKSYRKHQSRARKRAKKRDGFKGKVAANDLILRRQLEALAVCSAPAALTVVAKDTTEFHSHETVLMTTTAVVAAESHSDETSLTTSSSLEELPERMATEECFVLSLPYDVLTNGVLSYLRPEEMSMLGACSKYAKTVCEEGYLWQSLFKQKFPASHLTPMAMKEWKLAYQLSLSKIVDFLRCPSTKKTFLEDILGVGVNFTVNPKTKRVDYIDLSQDLLSETAFRQSKAQKDVFGNSFKLFLPLYFSEEHFQRALPHIRDTVRELGRSRQKNASRHQHFEPNMVLDVFPKMLTTFVVLLSDHGISACRKSYQGLTRIHRLFLALAHQYPEIKREAVRRAHLFVSDEKHRTKKECPNLGVVLPLLMIVDANVYSWPRVCVPYLNETFDRMVLWGCKKYPQLEKTHDPSGKVESEQKGDTRVDLTLKASMVNLRLVMLNVYFLKALCPGTTQERANRYDTFFGQPEPDDMMVVDTEGSVEDGETAILPVTSTPTSSSTIGFVHFRDRINYIMSVQTWQHFFPFLGLPCPPSKSDMARRLRSHVFNSRRKGYHKAGMDFSRVQASGTSKILSKGQEYSASSDLKQVVFRDEWGFEGKTKYLDATCLLYKGKDRFCTVDYKHKFASDGAVLHSGDQVSNSDGRGEHTIHLDLAALDPEVTSCVFVLSAWQDATLEDIKSTSISFINADTNTSLCTYDLDAQDKVSFLTSVVMCRLYRVTSGVNQGKWHVQAIGDAHKGAADNYGPIYAAVAKLL